MVLVQQVVRALVVDLDEANLQLVADLLRSLAELLEDVTQNAGNNAAVLPVVPAAHREGLARPGLPVGEDGAVVAVEAVVDDRLGDLLEDVVLGGAVGEDAVEGEGVVVLGVGQLVPGDLQFQRAVGELQIGQWLVGGL